SDDKPEPVNEKELQIPTYWIRPPQRLSAEAGMQRFVWDPHYAPPPGGRRTYPILAIYRDTPSEPMGPGALPGTYTVRLTVNGKSYTQPLTVKMDPRVKFTDEALAEQFKQSMVCDDGIRTVNAMLERAREMRGQLKSLGESSKTGQIAEAVAA